MNPLHWKYLSLSVLLLVGFESFSQSAAKAIKKADRAYEAEKYKKASHYFSKAIEEDSTSAEIIFKRAMSMYQLAFEGAEESSFGCAVEYLTAAISTDSTNAAAYQARGLTKFELANFSLGNDNFSRTKEFATEAIKDLEQAMQLDSNYAHLTNTIGIIESMVLGETGNALNAYSSVIEEYGDNFSAFWNRAHLRSQNQDYLAAAEDFRQVIRITGSNTEQPRETLFLWSSYVHLGDCLANLGQYDSAIHEYSQVLTLHPKFYRALHQRGLAKWAVDDRDGACRDWKKAGKIAKADYRNNCK